MGGTGVTSSITGTPVQYAGGGGAGAFYTQGILAGLGVAGGGNGAAQTVPYSASIGFTGSSGLANTGGGGGGSCAYTGAAGGSGIVVIRYPSYLKQATSTTGSPTTYIAGPWRIYVFKASGTITF